MDYASLFYQSYERVRESRIEGRYIHLDHIEPLFDSYRSFLQIEQIGSSEQERPIYGFRLGHGAKRLLMWSQMHGNESTTTKALFDVLNFLKLNQAFFEYVTTHFSLYIIPMVNPDGAFAYTRVNGNLVDLNRDAQNRSQVESHVLRKAYDDFKPDVAFNLHDQRTIFSAGQHALPATVSFLTPAEDQERTVTLKRKQSMEIIGAMNAFLQQYIPGQVGRYDDGYNINCIGDTFQSLGTPTILFESGHFQEDYQREQTRKYIAASIIRAIEYIGEHDLKGEAYKSYFEIPENDKLFYDVILRKLPVIEQGSVRELDAAILYKETLNKSKIYFNPSLERLEPNLTLYGHKDLDMSDIGVEPIEKHLINEAFLTDLLRNI